MPPHGGRCWPARCCCLPESSMELALPALPHMGAVAALSPGEGGGWRRPAPCRPRSEFPTTERHLKERAGLWALGDGCDVGPLSEPQFPCLLLGSRWRVPRLLAFLAPASHPRTAQWVDRPTTGPDFRPRGRLGSNGQPSLCLPGRGLFCELPAPTPTGRLAGHFLAACQLPGMPAGDFWSPARCRHTSQGPLSILGFCFR